MGRAKRILVIDDDPQICQAMETILGDNGYEVYAATDTVRGEALLQVQEMGGIVDFHTTVGRGT
ncbi:MAG: hypothetical protein ACUVR9_14780, partial [Desulfosoma sp.]